MNSITRSTVAAPLAGRTAVRWYSQSGIVVAGGMMAGQTPSRSSLSPSTCSCGGGGRSLPQVPLLPLQTRRGAAKTTAKKSPTVRRAQNAAKVGKAAGATGTATTPMPAGATTRLGPSLQNVGKAFAEDTAVYAESIAEGIDMLESDLTVEECLEVIETAKFIEQNKVSVNEGSLLRDYNITPYKIHCVGVFLLFNKAPRQQGQGSFFTVAMSLLHLATVAGKYMPSALTIVHILGVPSPDQTPQQAAQFARSQQSNIYQHAEDVFLEYLNKANASNNNVMSQDSLVIKANAFTLAGKLAETSGNKARALRWLKAAKEVGKDIGPKVEGEGDGKGKGENNDIKPRDQKWDWERQCLETIGQLQADVPDVVTVDEAREALRTAVLALNSGKVAMLLATKYAYDSSSRTEAQSKEMDEIMQHAAVSGDADASEVLAGREAIWASSPGLSKEEAAFHDKASDEWRRLAEALRKME